jgi:hypothetical protein
MSSKALPAVDLSDAFNKSPSRAAGLRMPAKRTSGPRKALQPVVPVREDAQEVADPPRANPQAPQAPPGGEPRPRRGRPPKKTTATVGRPSAGQARLVLWTPVSIRARMQAVQRSQGTLYLDQVLDAIETTYDQLADLVTQATGTTQVLGRLFERTAPTNAEPAEQRVQLTIRGVLDSQLRIIDDLVEQTGAPSRSALVNAALDATLPPC